MLIASADVGESLAFDTEPIVAWRAWELAPHPLTTEPLLRSITYRIHWPRRRPMRAHCLSAWSRRRYLPPAHLSGSRPTAPILGCQCGVYGVKTEMIARSWGGSFTAAGQQTGRVIGQVSLWGHVILCTDGYRAEYAYPLRILVPAVLAWHDFSAAEIARLLEGAYGVLVESYD